MKKIKKEVKIDKVELISYAIKMTIPTGPFANICPEIIVKAGSMEEAHAFIAPHINKLWKEYYMVSERRPESNVTVTVVANPNPINPEATPVSSVALIKATQAINSCLSLEALEMIKNQIEVSTKLTPEDKSSLLPLLAAKIIELNGQANPTKE